MNKDIIRMKCDRILMQKSPVFSKILNNRIQTIYEKHKATLGTQIDYMLFTGFMSEILSVYSGVISEIMVEIIQEVFADDDFDNEDDFD